MGEENSKDKNRLFGKLVDKMNSGKKSGFKTGENSYKTSIFGENSEQKHNRMEQTTGRQEAGAFRQLFTQLMAN